jgi:site-specific recombinase XerD
MAPGLDWAWLDRGARQRRATIRPSRAKLSRLRHPRRLLALGMTLMREAEREPRAMFAARGFRDGLLIAVLAACPLRRANMAGLRLGSSLQRRGETWWIHLREAETKNGRPIEAPLPTAMTEPMDRYIADFRPRLLAGNHDDHLWITKDGSWMRPHALHARVTRLTQARLGVRINPHLFRDCAATSIAFDDPAHIWITRDVLGHRSMATSQRYYNQAPSIDAARAWQRRVRDLRRRRAGPPSD